MNYTDLIQSGVVVLMAGGLVVAYRQMGLMARQIQNQYEWSKRNHALSYSLTRSQTLRQARERLDKAFDPPLGDREEPLTLEEIKLAKKKDAAVNTLIHSLLGHWENLALAIELDIADEDVAREMVASTVLAHVKVFRPFIDGRRKKESRRIYFYLLKLAAEWEQKFEPDPIKIDKPSRG